MLLNCSINFFVQILIIFHILSISLKPYRQFSKRPCYLCVFKQCVSTKASALFFTAFSCSFWHDWRAQSSYLKVPAATFASFRPLLYVFYTSGGSSWCDHGQVMNYPTQWMQSSRIWKFFEQGSKDAKYHTCQMKTPKCTYYHHSCQLP